MSGPGRVRASGANFLTKHVACPVDFSPQQVRKQSRQSIHRILQTCRALHEKRARRHLSGIYMGNGVS